MARSVALSFAALLILGLFEGCASTTPPSAEPAPAAVPQPAPSELTTPAESPAAVESDGAGSEGTPAASTEEAPTQETSAPAAEEPKPECVSTSDCQAKGKPDKGSKWACAAGVCEQVKTPARKKSK